MCFCIILDNPPPFPSSLPWSINGPLQLRHSATLLLVSESLVFGGGLHFHVFIIQEQPRTINSAKLCIFNPLFYCPPQRRLVFYLPDYK